MQSSFKKKGHLFDKHTTTPKKNKGTIEPRRNPWVHHQQLVTLLKVHQLSECWLRTPFLYWQFHHNKKTRCIYYLCHLFVDKTLNNLNTLEKTMHHIILEGISITPAPSLPWQPLLPGNLSRQHPSVGITLQVPNPPELKHTHTHTKKDLINWRNTLKTKTLETSSIGVS